MVQNQRWSLARVIFIITDNLQPLSREHHGKNTTREGKGGKRCIV